MQTSVSVSCCGGKEEHEDHLLPGQGDHVQRAVHEATCEDLLQVFCEHSVVHTVVGSHVLSKEGERNVNGNFPTLSHV